MGFFSTSKSAKLKSLHPARHAAAKLWKTGDVDEALDAALEGLDADPGDAVALHALFARCHAANRDFADAATHFAAALDAVPLDERPDGGEVAGTGGFDSHRLGEIDLYASNLANAILLQGEESGTVVTPDDPAAFLAATPC